ncbi:MAG: hypothetical protein ACE5IP_08510 [Terriglobia bacterium]
MPEEIPREEVLAAERRVLQAMCTGTPQGTVWDKGMLLLGPYPFQDVIHQLIFDTMQEINTDLPEVIRQQLTARLTKKGFPAVDTERFLAAHTLNGREAVELMKKLRTWARGEERTDATLR